MPKASCEIIYRPLLAGDVDIYATLCAEAFTDNTAYNYIFQYDKVTHSDDHFASNKWLFERRLGIVLDYEYPAYVAVNESTGEVVGGACCILKATKPGILGLLRAGLAVWPFYWGVASAWRGLSVDEEFDTIEKSLYPNSEAAVANGSSVTFLPG
eukprot:CAMPEP_0114425312 /NCGR_PEP_ID=MMETSP0103-20121206/7168_1 /TAXON_ID=37642 ORGANISM="Paraphysomonas imperforata, Strain PA2" /NCGR_SAMPLE_ID=MMETSP0103 /ASSEMBLY_ACC=CAM_ASM_000201 /LENGTH=154 /DNA_ID=CAMNT_0001594139 /DNA_START=49 /DNA_END=512 /DNA_ORIENTATION=+